MPDWWTYTLADIQSFSLQTYHRLFELYNAAIWPAQIVAIALGSGLHLPHRGPGFHTRRGRLVAAVLAACWLWVAIAFHAARYAQLTWAAVCFAWGFGLEAALLLWTGVVRGRLVFERSADAVARAGLGIFVFALAVQPLLGLLLGRSWRQVEIFGVAPDPTAVATLAAMKAPEAWITPVAAVLVASLATWRTLARRRRQRERA